MSSHYIPPFPHGRRRKAGHVEQTAVCGFWTRPDEHSTEPTCPRCAAYLGRKAEPSPVPRLPAEQVYDCTRCRAEKRGRFTLPIDASGNGWDRGFQHLLWYCWTCLPLGQGRYDDVRTPEELTHAR